MEITDRIKEYLSKDDYKSKSPEGFCPNCWGRQEYSGEFFKALKSQNVDTGKIEKGWINDYAEKHLLGIQLKEENGNQACPLCRKVV